jgi:hypothetical protein
MQVIYTIVELHPSDVESADGSYRWAIKKPGTDDALHVDTDMEAIGEALVKLDNERSERLFLDAADAATDALRDLYRACDYDDERFSGVVRELLYKRVNDDG